MAQLATRDPAKTIEDVLVEGDLSALSPAQRVEFYQRVCSSLGLNLLTKPFEYLRLNNKLLLYARKDATDQLRKINGVSITRLEREQIGQVYVVTAYAEDKTGRRDSSMGAVPIEGLRGEALSNALMKAETKSKRRVTLSLCGLGVLDESEIGSIPDAVVVAAELSPAEQSSSSSSSPSPSPPPPSAKALPRRERDLDELVSLYESKLEQAREDGVVADADLPGWRLPSPVTRPIVIGFGKRLNEAQERQQAMTLNESLLRQAEEARVPGSLGRFKAEAQWTLEQVTAANTELSERVAEREGEAETAAF